MIENGLKYYDSRTATEAEFTDDLEMTLLNNKEQRMKGGPVLFRKEEKIYTDPSDLHNLIVGNIWHIHISFLIKYVVSIFIMFS